MGRRSIFYSIPYIAPKNGHTKVYNQCKYYQNNINPKTVLKQTFPELTVISDVAMDPYSSDGHDGIVDER